MKNIKLIIIILMVMIITGCTNVLETKQKINLTKKEKIDIKLVEESNNIYTMKIPSGWKMEIVGEYETFGFKLYDQKNPARQIFYYGKFSPFLKTDAAKKGWQNYVSTGGWNSSQYLADAYVLSNPTVEGFYELFDEFAIYANNYGIKHDFPVLGDYQLLERLDYSTPMGGLAKDEAILRLLLDQDGIPSEALVTATVVDAMTYNYAYNTDMGYYTVYVVSGIIAPSDEYNELEKIMSESLSSFTFSEDYIDKGVRQNQWETKVALEIGQILSKSYDSYNKAWWNRQKKNDVISQQLSDATLGYERLYDEKTGKVYRAETGFYDEYKDNATEYDNSNLKPIPDSKNDLYSESIEGYIKR